MPDSLEFLRKSNGQDTTTLILTLLRQVNALGVSINHSNTGTNIPLPTLPASGVNYTWLGTKPATVYLTGGTITNIAIGSSAFGIVVPPNNSTSVRVNPGDYIAISYTVAPTWQWYGD